MNSFSSHRVLNPLRTLAFAAMIIIATAISIELLYRGFQVIETTFQASSRQAHQYFTELVCRN